MEIVYLWIKQFKNIESEGFNFSPKFECKFDQKTKELIINENKENINIFPENINITAIVGENGSGKSALIQNFLMSSNGFFIIREKDELVIYRKKIPIQTDLKIIELKRNFFNNVLYYTGDINSISKSNRQLNIIDFNKTNELIIKNFNELKNIKFNLFNFEPKLMYYEIIRDWIAVDYNILDDDIERIKLSLDLNLSSDSGIIIDTITALKDIKDEYLVYLFNKFGNINEIFEYIDLREYLDPEHNYLRITIEEVQEVLNKYKINYVNKNIFTTLLEHSYQYININKLARIFGDNYLDLFFNQMIDDLEFDFMSENSAVFNSLSHGEKTIYSFYLNLINFQQETIILVLDEPDNTLHPNWQRKFINEIIQICTNLKIKAHIIINSHSPFILSDLPKENVIFLKKDRDYNCKNVTKETEINTFGANIHTLLSHGFFMEDGLMGEFAKEKITEIFDYLKENKSLKTIQERDVKNIIKLIGEDFLREKLLHMYELKFQKSNEEKIEELKKEIERLENASN